MSRPKRVAARCTADGRARQALADPHLLGPLDGRQVQRALPQEPRQGADGPLHRLRSADADRLRLRPRAGARRGRQGRRARLAHRRHAHAAGRHPARRHEHVDDDQRDGGVAAGALRRCRRRAGHAATRAHRHHPERHHQGIPLARHLRVPARAVAAADQGHHHLHHHGDAEVEPDQRVLLSPAGSRRDAGAGAGLCAGHRASRARRRARRRARWRRKTSARWSAASRSSSTPACASSPRSARCAPSRSCGTRSPPSATASPIPSIACSATACRSTRWA